MKHHKHKKKNTPKAEPQTREEMIYNVARGLAADTGISFSEALGYTLGVHDVYYGWENDLTEEEFQKLIEDSDDIPEGELSDIM